MASVRKKAGKSGTIWQSRWREPGKNGQSRQRTKNHASAKDAREHASRMEQEVERRGVGDPDRQTTAKFLHGWLALLEQRGEHSPSTLDGYRRNIGLAEREIGHIPLAKLSAADLDRAYATLLASGVDEIAEARWWQIEQAHRMRLEGLVEDIRKTLGGPRSATGKVAWLKELLAVQGYLAR